MKFQLINADQVAPSTLVTLMFNYDYISKEEDSVLVYIPTLRALGLWDIVNEVEKDVDSVKVYNMDTLKTKERLGATPKFQGIFGGGSNV